jgi:hypothetical protein
MTMDEMVIYKLLDHNFPANGGPAGLTHRHAGEAAAVVILAIGILPS